jgi:hypothetical protein
MVKNRDMEHPIAQMALSYMKATGKITHTVEKENSTTQNFVIHNSQQTPMINPWITLTG